MYPKDELKPLAYGELSDQEADEAWSHMARRQTWKSLCVFPPYIAADISVPKTWVLSEKDDMIPAQFQETMAGWGKYDHVLRLPSGHFPFLSMPDKVSEIIVEVAERVV